MEREREIRTFKPEDFWIITADVENKEKFTLTCVEEPRDKKEVDRIINVGEKEKWVVSDIKKQKENNLQKLRLLHPHFNKPQAIDWVFSIKNNAGGSKIV